MDHLLPHYERELTQLRQSMAHFASRYPKMASRLGIAGDHCEDVHVERMLQSFALVAAGIDSRLHDNDPEFTASLLGTVHPQALRPLPACSIARFELTEDVIHKLTAPVNIARGTGLTGKRENCRFRTVYDVTLAPVRIESAGYRSTANPPANVSLPPDATGVLSITFSSTQPGWRTEQVPRAVRVHLSGAQPLVSAMMDTMLLRTATAYVEVAGGRWLTLPRSPVTAVGVRAEERLIEEEEAWQPLRLLGEYFAFPKKFDFVDIDLRMLAAAAGTAGTLTLHLVVRDVHRDSRTAQVLAQLSAAHLQLFCTPVVNLFQITSLPLKRHLATGAYPVPSLNTEVNDGEVWSIDAVRTPMEKGRTSEIRPLTSLLHGSAAKLTGPYWVDMQRFARAHEETPDMALGLVGLDGQLMSQAGLGQLTADITYSNGNRPQSMAFGDEAGDLVNEQGPIATRIRMLCAPTEPKRLPLDGDAAWDLIAQLTPHSIELTRAGLDQFKRLLRPFARRTSGQGGLIDAMKNLSHRARHLWLPGEPMPSLARGFEVTLSLDEQAFVASAISAFICALDVFFARQVPETGFVQLIVISANSGAPIQRCEPRRGTRALI